MHSLYRVSVEVSQHVLSAVMLMVTELYHYIGTSTGADLGFIKGGG